MTRTARRTSAAHPVESESETERLERIIAPLVEARVAAMVEAQVAARMAKLSRVVERAELELLLAERTNRAWRGVFAGTKDFVRTYYMALVQMLRAGHRPDRLSPYYMARFLKTDGVRRYRLAGASKSTLLYRMGLVERDWSDWPDIQRSTFWPRLRAMAVACVRELPQDSQD